MRFLCVAFGLPAMVACLGCNAEPTVPAEARVPAVAARTWATPAGSPTLNRYMAGAGFSRRPETLWARRVPSGEVTAADIDKFVLVDRISKSRMIPSGHQVSTILADSNNLYVLCEIGRILQYVGRYPPQMATDPVYRGHIYMLGIRLRDGKRLWKHDEDELFGYEWEMLGGPQSKGPLVLEGDRLYAATETGLLVLDTASGTVKKRLREDWRYRDPLLDKSVKTVTWDYPRSMVVGPGGELIYLATREGQVICRDLKTGADLWRTWLLKERSAAEKAKDPARRPKIDLALQGQTLVALGFGGPKIDMAAFSVADGKVLWRRNSFPKSAWPLCFSIAGDKVVVPGVQWFGFWGKKGDTFVSTFDLQSGKDLRSIRLPGLPGGVCSDGESAWLRVMPPDAPEHEEVVCVDLDSGRRKWLSNGLEVMTSPTLIGKTILVLCEGDMLRCLSSDSGDLLWEMDLSPGQDRWYDHLLVVGNRIVVWGPAYATVLAAAD